MPENKVENPKTNPKPSEDVYNDKDKLNDLLISAKYLSKQYGTFAEEASNDALYNEIGTLSKDMCQLARDTFNLMFEKGWYKLEAQTAEKIQTIHQTHKQAQSQIGK